MSRGPEDGVSYAFALRPKWIVWHVVAIAAVVTMVNLGFWQLRRLDERRTENAVVLARTEIEPVPVGSLLRSDTPLEEIDGLTFRRVTATGEFRTSDEVLVRNRSNGGAPGYWVLTPIAVDDGPALVVNRGWIPLPYGDGGDPAVYAPPSGRVTVTGVVQASQIREGIGIEDPPTGRLGTLSRVDVPRLAAQVDYPVLPAYVDLIGSEPPPPNPVPQFVPARELDDGSHVNYAGQWFIFTTLTLITYPLLLRRTARRHAMVPPVEASPDPVREPIP